MKVETFDKVKLQQFINSRYFFSLQNIPISRNRAISQINNPRAIENDKILFVVFDNERVVGYFGVLPDYIHIQGKREKIGWGSCFWVDENYKSQNVAASLFLRVIREWNQKLFITNIVPYLEPIYQKTKIFCPTVNYEGFRGYLRFNLADILPPKYKLFANTKGIIKYLDIIGNFFNSIRLSFYNVRINLKYEFINTIDDQTFEFIESRNLNEAVKRNKKELEWIYNYPWIIAGTLPDINSSRYYFSSVDNSFNYLMLKVFTRENNMVAFIFLSIRNGNLTVPYFYCEQDEIQEIIKLLYLIMLSKQLKMVTVFNHGLAKELFSSKSPFLFKKRISRPYLIPKLYANGGDFSFQDGDGDVVFT